MFRLTHGRKIVNVEVSKLIWVLPYTQVDQTRLKQADVTKPILVYDDKKYGLTAIDGAHRLVKAVNSGMKQIPAVMLTDMDMRQAEIK